MKKPLVLCAITLAIMLAIWLSRLQPSTTANQVTLHAAPGNRIVQMFQTVGDGPNDIVFEIADGTRCTRIANPTTVSVAGSSLRFDLLNCNGNVGYVNVKWVDD